MTDLTFRPMTIDANDNDSVVVQNASGEMLGHLKRVSPTSPWRADRALAAAMGIDSDRDRERRLHVFGTDLAYAQSQVEMLVE